MWAAGVVAWRSGVDDVDSAPCPAEDQGCAEPGGATADDHHVDAGCVHVGHLDVHCSPRRPADNFRCRSRESVVGSQWMREAAGIDDVLAAVGPRLRWLRNQRDVTLTELAAATGISKSTLSRLESGGRKLSLELLLPIAQAHRVPLDELGAPDIGDPGIRLQPERRSGGRIVVPLTRQPRGGHAWKVVIPPERGQPKLRAPREHPRPGG
jgi:transcriptional regulator with XRE-family HTH domain